MKKLITALLVAVVGIPLYIFSKIEPDESSLDVSIVEDVKDYNTNENSNPVFTYSEIPDHIKDKMIGKSMPSNEPVNFDSLSYLTLTYLGFDGNTHIGEMVVDSRLASEVVDIFEELYNEKYPIEKIRLIDEYDAIDNASMADNNSSAFCYRTIANTDKISNHGLGLAIDINPLKNPHVIGDIVSPEEGYVYADRSNSSLGMIHEGDAAYNAFTKRGWSWGGHWNNPDYQHFEKSL